LFLVFSNPAESIDEGEFNAFQDAHVRENLVAPGYLTCRRYKLALGSGNEYPSHFRYVSIYEVAGTREERSAQTAALYPDRAHPSWWGDVAISSCGAESVAGSVDPTGPDRLFLVFSATPPQMTFDQYSDWYHEHLQQNIAASPLLSGGWRYHIEGGPKDEKVPDHLALYALSGPPTEMLAATTAAQRAGRTSSVEGFHTLANFDAVALDARVS